MGDEMYMVTSTNGSNIEFRLLPRLTHPDPLLAREVFRSPQATPACAIYWLAPYPEPCWMLGAYKFYRDGFGGRHPPVFRQGSKAKSPILHLFQVNPCRGGSGTATFTPNSKIDRFLACLDSHGAIEAASQKLCEERQMPKTSPQNAPRAKRLD